MAGILIPAQDFDTRIEIHRPSGVPNAVGQPVQSAPLVLLKLWARRQMRDERRRTADNVERIVSFPVFTVRYTELIAQTDLVKCNGKTYRIDAVVPSDDRNYTIIKAYDSQ
jgi:SPP1 family predicted phage head-tail adaptor